jgi:hypothetical protein
LRDMDFLGVKNLILLKWTREDNSAHCSQRATVEPRPAQAIDYWLGLLSDTDTENYINHN